jgi:hypothetical protein
MKDYTLGETIDFKFTTCEPDTGAPITFAGSPVISAYVDNSTTQITAGITLTVDFDGVTGLHNVRVVATSGNGYTTGTNVALIVTTGTVDSVSAVGYKVAEFSLGRAGTANVTQFGGSAGTFASGVPAVNATQISGDSTAADNLETAFDDTAGAVRWMQITDQGTAQAATGTTLQLRAAAAFADDELIGQTVFITGGSTGVGQSRLITDYVSATDTATVDTWTTTPTGTITYKICPTAPSTGGAGLDAAGVRAAIGMSSANLDTQLATINTVVDAILVDTGTTLDGRIPAALVGGRMDCTIDGTGMEAGAVTAVQSGLALAADLATVDTVVDAIKAKTDSLTFTVANVLDGNIQRINDVAITGDGQPGTEFNV